MLSVLLIAISISSNDSHGHFGNQTTVHIRAFSVDRTPAACPFGSRLRWVIWVKSWELGKGGGVVKDGATVPRMVARVRVSKELDYFTVMISVHG